MSEKSARHITLISASIIHCICKVTLVVDWNIGLFQVSAFCPILLLYIDVKCQRGSLPGKLFPRATLKFYPIMTQLPRIVYNGCEKKLMFMPVYIYILYGCSEQNCLTFFKCRKDARTMEQHSNRIACKLLNHCNNDENPTDTFEHELSNICDCLTIMKETGKKFNDLLVPDKEHVLTNLFKMKRAVVTLSGILCVNGRCVLYSYG